MKQVITGKRNVVLRISATGAVALAAVALLSAPSRTASSGGPDSKYIGASKCKSCHSSEETGNQYGAWEHAKHSKAYETLGMEQAKKIGAERGIEDPQKSDQCLKCHVTAFGVDPKQIKRGFKIEDGVQCETCHGPGEDHMKARFAAAASDNPNAKPEPGEIIARPTEETCKQCHNSEGPTFKGFCFTLFSQKIAHPNPKKAVEAKAVDCKSCHDPVPPIPEHLK